MQALSLSPVVMGLTVPRAWVEQLREVERHHRGGTAKTPGPGVGNGFSDQRHCESTREIERSVGKKQRRYKIDGLADADGDRGRR